MKTYKILAFMAAMVLTFSACETEVEDPAGLRNEGIIPSVTNLKPAVFDVNEPAETFIKFDLDVAPGVDKIIVVASYNGDLRRSAIQEFSSFPAKDVKIYMRDVAAALNVKLEDIAPGDVFNLEMLTVQGDKTYRSNAVVNAGAVCAYDVDNVTGAYYAVSDDWGSEGPITITADPANPFILYVSGLATMDGLVEDGDPLKMVVNELDFTVKAEKTVIATAFFQYTNGAYEGFGNLNTCDGTYKMFFTISVDQGSFGQNAFTLTKL